MAADGMGLSEQTLKRIFACKDCSLERLEQICQYLQIEMRDVLKSAPKRRRLIEQLSHAQERVLAENKTLLIVAVCAMGLWRVEDMLAHLNVTETECFTLMRRLEAIGFLELRGGDQYRLLVAPDFSWNIDGPIMRLVKGVSDDFFNHRFDGPGEVLKIVNVRASIQAQERLKLRLEQIAQEYADQVTVDSHLALQDRPVLSVCIATRRWVPAFLRDMLRSQEAVPSVVAELTRGYKVQEKDTFTPPW